MTTSAEMPKYRSHKEVWALKIKAIEIHYDQSATVAVEEPFAPIATRPGYGVKFQGGEEDLGYYVQYQDGYESWSPTKAFEEGYTKIED